MTFTRMTKLADATPDWQVFCEPEEERHGDIREPDSEPGRTRFYCREGMNPKVGYPAIGSGDDAIRKWLEDKANGVWRRTH